jgi:hypothetical protein
VVVLVGREPQRSWLHECDGFIIELLVQVGGTAGELFPRSADIVSSFV